MSTKILMYNEALMICGERSISSLTEARECRELLDHVWDNGGVDACLAEAQWKFAMRTIEADYDTSVTTQFGYKRAYTKPSDWIVTSSVCSDEYFNVPLLQYVDEAGYWYCDIDVIYVRYVSNASTYGGDIGSWPQTFADFVSGYFAHKIILKLSSDEDRWAGIEKKKMKLLKEARSRDAMADPTKFPAQGGWTSSRRGGARRDRGNRNSLIG
ncbi:MAG TPA: hypothetical protein ENH10_01645 [Bacteroidetes bacterium]|nr:hypothetical protein [Bacteroidota bacterium]HEX03850.1 hypothetical protein [Bacteroidota bacterium]